MKRIVYLGVLISIVSFQSGLCEIASVGKRFEKMDTQYSLQSRQTLSLSSNCHEEEVLLSGQDPLNGTQSFVRLLQYSPLKRASFKTEILIHPPTKTPEGGSNALDRGYARSFCRRGIRTTIMEGWSGYFEPNVYDFGTHDRATVRAVYASAVALKYIHAPVFLIGTSIGAIYGSFVMGLYPQVKGGVLVVGGAPLHEVLLDTNQEHLAKLRRHRMQMFGIKEQDDYEEKLIENIYYSPENFVDPKKSDFIQIVMASRDRTVSFKTQEKLWEAWGKPTKLSFPFKHVSTILASFLTQKSKHVDSIAEEIKKIEAAPLNRGPDVLVQTPLHRLKGVFQGVGVTSLDAPLNSKLIKQLIFNNFGSFVGKFLSERLWSQTSDGALYMDGQYEAEIGSQEISQKFNLKFQPRIGVSEFDIYDQRTLSWVGESDCIEERCAYRFLLPESKTFIHEEFKVSEAGGTIQVFAGEQRNQKFGLSIWNSYQVKLKLKSIQP